LINKKERVYLVHSKTERELPGIQFGANDITSIPTGYVEMPQRAELAYFLNGNWYIQNSFR
jgi:hypothetical protein